MLSMDWRCIEYLNAFLEYEKGFLPNSGGWLEQPMKVTQAIRLIDDRVKEHEDNRIKEAEKRNGRYET